MALSISVIQRRGRIDQQNSREIDPKPAKAAAAAAVFVFLEEGDGLLERVREYEAEKRAAGQCRSGGESRRNQGDHLAKSQQHIGAQFPTTGK